ncbi:MAG: flavodoxin family protein [Deltaproteobacteria bacterium]|jgi:multimeric flavodoxin WrbA|nr:flavodoxin family protein [Deltaproteobacteria bacterium]
MKVTVILGSPRLDSNSEKLARAAAAALTGPQEPPEVFKLNELRYRGCQACMGCKTKKEFCVLRDDLTRVLSSAAGADFVILTSPIYIGDISSQLKGFVDRAYSWLNPDYLNASVRSRVKSGKKLLFIVTQGHPELGAYKKTIDNYLGYFGNFHGFSAASFFAPIGDANLEKTKPELLDEVVKAAKAL